MQTTVGNIASYLNGKVITNFDNVETNAVIVDNETNFKAGRAITFVAGKVNAGVAGGTGEFAGLFPSADQSGMTGDEFQTRDTPYLGAQHTVYSGGFKAHIQLFDYATGLVADTAAAVKYKVGFRHADGKWFAIPIATATPANTTVILDQNSSPRAFVSIASDSNGYATIEFKH